MASICEQCAQLEGVIRGAVEGLAKIPTNKQAGVGEQLTAARQELLDLETANSLLSVKADSFDSGATPAPPDVLTGIGMVVANCTEVVAELREGILLEAARHRRALETGKKALGAAARGLDIATSLAAAEKNGDSPPYQSTLIYDEILAIKVRLAEDRDKGINGLQIAVLTEFLDCLQQYAAAQSGNVVGPSSMQNLSLSDFPRPGASGNGEGPSRSSPILEDMHQPSQPIPAYSAVDTPRAPHRIRIRQISRIPDLEYEPLDVAFDPLSRIARVAVADLYSRVRFFLVRGHSGSDSTAVIALNMSTTGMHMTLSPSAPPRMAVVAEGSNQAPAVGGPVVRHDLETFQKGSLVIADYSHGSRVVTFKQSGGRPFSFSRNGAYLAARGPRGRVEIVSGLDGKGVAVVRSHTEEVVDAKFTADGSGLVSMSRDGTLRVTSTATWHGTAKLEVAEWRNPVLLALPAAKSRVVLSVWGRKVYLWDPDTEALDKWDLDAGEGVTTESWPLAASPDLRYLCCRNEQGADIREVVSGRVLCRLKFEAGFVTTAGWSADSKMLALGWMSGGVMGQGKGRVDIWEIID